MVTHAAIWWCDMAKCAVEECRKYAIVRIVDPTRRAVEARWVCGNHNRMWIASQRKMGLRMLNLPEALADGVRNVVEAAGDMDDVSAKRKLNRAIQLLSDEYSRWKQSA